MSKRKPYDQGYLDGLDAGVKEMQGHEEQAKRLADLYERAIALMGKVQGLPDKPPAAAGPEPMPEGWVVGGRGEHASFGYRRLVAVSVSMMRSLLATQGLAIVPAADVVTKEERRLQADAREWAEQWRATAIEWQEWAEKLLTRLGLQWKDGVMGARVSRATIEAELARRAAKGGKP